MEIRTLKDLDLEDKIVLARIDINSPITIETGEILDDMRIKSHLPTIEALKNSKLVLLAHQSRPGRSDFTTLEKHAKILEKLCSSIRYIDCVFGSTVKREIDRLENGAVLLLENVRFCSEETHSDVIKMTLAEQAQTILVKKLSSYVDAYVNDAFAVSHRNQPSVVAFPQVLPSCAGKLVENEVTNLENVLTYKEKPRVFLMGGAKAKDSIKVIKKIMNDGVADAILTSGLVGTIFLSANGMNIGKENKKVLKEKGLEPLVPEARRLLKKYRERIEMPVDLAFQKNGSRHEFSVKNPEDHQIMDIGAESISRYGGIVGEAKIVVANGPCGIFEKEEFSVGTEELLKSVAESKGFSVISGGHLAAMAQKLNIANKISYISTGGKATMSFLAGEKLPGIEALKKV